MPGARSSLAGWVVGLSALAVAAGAGSAAAEDYPSKPVHVIVPISAGSVADVVPRIVFEQVATLLGQPFIVENRVGAGGIIGANAVAKSEPDGYTLLSTSNALTTAPLFIKNVPFDVKADFAGIAPLGNLPHVLVISKSQGITTLKGLIDAAAKRPDGITFGAVVGTPIYLNAEHFRQTMKVNARAVPFRGAPEALTEVLGGRIDIYFSPISVALPFISDGRMVPLAVTAKQRSAALPNVPTTFEQDYPNSEFGLWLGAWAPAKTPAAVIEKLHAAVAKALASETSRKRLAEMAIEPMNLDPKAFDAYVANELARNSALAQAAGIVAQ